MTTGFLVIQHKLIEKYNKYVEAINAIAEGTRVFQSMSFADAEQSPLANSDIDYMRDMLNTVRKERIVRICPYDLQSRLEEAGEELNHTNIVHEAKYVLQMIQDGGSDYDAEDTTEYVAQLEKLIFYGSKIK